jgi:hypothetical protein
MIVVATLATACSSGAVTEHVEMLDLGEILELDGTNAGLLPTDVVEDDLAWLRSRNSSLLRVAFLDDAEGFRWIVAVDRFDSRSMIDVYREEAPLDVVRCSIMECDLFEDELLREQSVVAVVALEGRSVVQCLSGGGAERCGVLSLWADLGRQCTLHIFTYPPGGVSGGIETSLWVDRATVIAQGLYGSLQDCPAFLA